MKKWQTLLLGLISFVGLSFGHNLVVKIITVDAPEPEEEIIFVQKPRKHSRSIASQSGHPPEKISYYDQRSARTSQAASGHFEGGSVGEDPVFAGEMRDTNQSSGFNSQPNYHSSNTHSNYRPSPSSNGVTSNSKNQTSASATRSPSSALVGGAFTTTPPSTAAKTNPTTPTDRTSSTTLTPNPAHQIEVISKILTFNSTDSSQYVVDPTELDFSQNFLELLLPTHSKFVGNKIGVDIETLSSGAEALGLGLQGSCDGRIQNCAEFDSSWTPKWSDLEGVWHFNERSTGSAPGGKDFVDSSGRGNHGSRVRSGTLGAQGKIKGSLQNTNANPNSAALPVNLAGTNQVTIAFWYNNRSTPITTSGTNLLLELSPDMNSNYGGFYYATGDSSSPLMTAGSSILIGSSSFNTYYSHQAAQNKLGWQHITLTFDRSALPNRIQMYIDGKQIPSSEIGGLNTSAISNFINTNLYLFGRTGNSYDGKGEIDELAVWKTILTPAEIKQIYDRQSTSFGDAEALGFFESAILDATNPFAWTALEWSTLFANSKRPLVNDDPTSYPLGSNQLKDALIAYWKFDEAAGTTGTDSIKDSSGNGNHLTPSANFAVGEKTKVNTGAFINNNPTGYAIPNNTNAFRMDNDDFTVSAWFKSNPTNHDQYIISRSVYGAVDGRWGLAVSASGQLFIILDFPSQEIWATTPSTYNDGKWHFVVLRMKRNSAAEIYVDGDLKLSRDISSYVGQPLNANTLTLISGYADASGTAPITSVNSSINGSLDEMGVWRRALSAEEIKDLYLRGATSIKHQIRACVSSDCSDKDWMGPDSTINSFYSELMNEQSAAPVVPFTAPLNAQYFQFRTIFESSLNPGTATPILTEIKTSNWTEDYSFSATFVTELIESKKYKYFVEELGPQGCQEGISYQLSTLPVGPWYYWNGTSWQLSIIDTDVNQSGQITEQAFNQFYSQFGEVGFHVKGKLSSDGTSPCELESLEFKN